MRGSVDTSLDDGVLSIVIDDGELNVLDEGIIEALGAAISTAEQTSVRAVLLLSGARVFSAGADIRRLAELSTEDFPTWNERIQRLFTRLSRLDVPVVASISGHALGGGYELALAADVRVMGQAARVGLPEVRLGIIPGAGGTQRLTRLVGPHVACRLLLGGEQYGAAEALSFGLVDDVSDDPDLRAREVAARLAENPREVAAAVKEAVSVAAGPLDAGLAHEQELICKLFAGPAQREMVRSFLKKRSGDRP